MDLQPFLGEQLFRRLPHSNLKGNATTTCSCLMALATSSQVLKNFNSLFGFDEDIKSQQRVTDMLRGIASGTWTSSGLLDGNAFSSLLIIRTAGLLSTRREKILTEAALPMSHTFQVAEDQTEVAKPFEIGMTCSLSEILDRFAPGVPRSFSVDKYPPTSTIGYWFVDAVDKLDVNITTKTWEKMVKWSSRSLTRQIALATSTHDSMRDPIEMAMAACLCQRLKRLTSDRGLEFEDETKESIPTNIELHDAILKFFDSQLKSGIWPKYFPLFNYRKGGTGSNYVFNFEMLEIVVDEFSKSRLLDDPSVLGGLGRALSWCENNRLTYRYKEKDFSGWNSGGQLETLSQGKPESWATAMVHMFLHRLRDALSARINKLVLLKYGATSEVVEKNPDPWNGLIDSPVVLKDHSIGLKQLLEDELLGKFERNEGISPVNKIIGRRSALLFGPPGTSKTTFVRNAAKKIGWPLVELNPSHFLKRGLENIYSQAEEIFDDLNDLSWAVVFFDEMDALAQRRDAQNLDITRQLLTTSMLPKLSRLHGQAKVLYFMATNHQMSFDPAIKRPRRFDLLICVAPPTWSDKLTNLEEFLDNEPEIDLIRMRLKHLIGSSEPLIKLLNLFTFDDFKSFLESFERPLRRSLQGINKSQFQKIVKDWASTQITLTDQTVESTENLSARKEFEIDKIASRRQ
ncbi:MAG TPA: ATP-binding protein [Pyrinomonadaceae bacterium]|nr:ATP-binding protein [Pyrinomonadaceae bacterium]